MCDRLGMITKPIILRLRGEYEDEAKSMLTDVIINSKFFYLESDYSKVCDLAVRETLNKKEREKVFDMQW